MSVGCGSLLTKDDSIHKTGGGKTLFAKKTLFYLHTSGRMRKYVRREPTTRSDVSIRSGRGVPNLLQNNQVRK